MTPKAKLLVLEDNDDTNCKKKCQEGISPLDFKVNTDMITD